MYVLSITCVLKELLHCFESRPFTTIAQTGGGGFFSLGASVYGSYFIGLCVCYHLICFLPLLHCISQK